MDAVPAPRRQHCAVRRSKDDHGKRDCLERAPDRKCLEAPRPGLVAVGLGNARGTGRSPVDGNQQSTHPKQGFVVNGSDRHAEPTTSVPSEKRAIARRGGSVRRFSSSPLIILSLSDGSSALDCFPSVERHEHRDDAHNAAPTRLLHVWDAKITHFAPPARFLPEPDRLTARDGWRA